VDEGRQDTIGIGRASRSGAQSPGTPWTPLVQIGHSGYATAPDSEKTPVGRFEWNWSYYVQRTVPKAATRDDI
jgi:hypothetical protein